MQQLDQIYAPIKAVSCEGGANIDATSNSISDFSLKSEGGIKGTLNISASGSISIHSEGKANLKLNASTDKLKCKLEGGGELKLSGSASKLTCKLGGKGTLDAASLKTHECKLKLEGKGSVSVYADKSLKVKAEGKWKGSYAGNPKSVDIDPEGKCKFERI